MDKPKVYLKQLIEGTIEILFYMEVSGLTYTWFWQVLFKVSL